MFCAGVAGFVAGRNWNGRGWEGGCALFVREQGQAAPVDQLVSQECKGTPEQAARSRLPVRFEIYAECRCPTFLRAVGVTEQGVWARTELLDPVNAVAYPDESEREFSRRREALEKHRGHAD